MVVHSNRIKVLKAAVSVVYSAVSHNKVVQVVLAVCLTALVVEQVALLADLLAVCSMHN